MCRLFVRTVDCHQIVDKVAGQATAKGLWQKGDVVDILEDGVSGGKKAEASTNFLIVEMPGVSVSEMHHLLESNSSDCGSCKSLPKPDPECKLCMGAGEVYDERRKNKFDYKSLNASELTNANKRRLTLNKGRMTAITKSRKTPANIRSLGSSR